MPDGGHLCEGVLLMAAVLVVTAVLFRHRPPVSLAQDWRVGAGWLAGTVIVEFVLGRWVLGRSWSELLAAYTFAGRNLWPLVLLTLLLAPPWLARRR